MDPKELIKDEAFKAQLENAKAIGEVVELLKSKGVEVTEEILKGAVAPEGELGEEALEGVAGGSWWNYLRALVYNAGGGGFSRGGGGSGAFGGGGVGGGR